jgi:sulfoxide reductase heme-binding subunit YedZ
VSISDPELRRPAEAPQPRRRDWRQRAIRPLQVVVFLLALIPALKLARGVAIGYLGIDPVETLAIETGTAAITLLLCSLAVTPVRRLTGWNELIRFRRLLGLMAFFYAVLHVATYVVFDQEGSITLIAADVLEHPWVLFGMTAFLLLIPLAITSTKGWIRRLGGKRWNRLHRLVYPAAIAAVLHFLLAVKLDVRKPVLYIVILAVLLGARLVWARQRSRMPQRAARERQRPLTATEQGG